MNSDNVTAVLNELASKIGVSVSLITPELAKMNIAQGIFVCTIVVIILVISIASTIHFFKIKDEDAVAISIVITIGMAVILMFSGYDLVGWIASPTGKTIEYVLSKL